MMYSPTETTYLRLYEELVTFANGGHIAVLKYFDDNWKDCRNICNEYFHAGNTTTNCIESNWSLLKRLLGKTTRIDNMTTSLLAHQRAVIDQVLYDIQRHILRSRPPATIPDFRRRNSVLMRKYVLRQVRRQWEMFVVSKIAWTCMFAFYKSQYLPCQHLMFVAHNGHGFEEFSLSALPVVGTWTLPEH
ncbi:hypothetical protein PHMEG_0004129 [Phytophthora megakarya]|uniref:Uncharacterized protein n=1 Tax=Phytophthora megakarya TaxID=4795 RepID=A0A225WUP7_9STRA|nr:hypothetical protein PHMEG_0004129 [Phytophthora megakarya]